MVFQNKEPAEACVTISKALDQLSVPGLRIFHIQCHPHQPFLQSCLEVSSGGADSRKHMERHLSPAAHPTGWLTIHSKASRAVTGRSTAFQLTLKASLDISWNLTVLPVRPYILPCLWTKWFLHIKPVWRRHFKDKLWHITLRPHWEISLTSYIKRL